jgi:hypothetical protein
LENFTWQQATFSNTLPCLHEKDNLQQLLMSNSFSGLVVSGLLPGKIFQAYPSYSLFPVEV